MKSSRALLRAVPVAALAALAGCSSTSSSPSSGATTASASSSPAAVASASAVTSTAASATASAPASAVAAASGPAQPAGSTVYFAGSGTLTGPALFEPSCGAGCLLTGDSTAALFNMTWPTWGATEAVGAGTEKLDNCTPNCAAGEMEAVAVRVTFSKPVTVNCGSTGTRQYWTRASFSWPNGLPADLSAGGGPTNPMVYSGIGGDGSCG